MSILKIKYFDCNFDIFKVSKKILDKRNILNTKIDNLLLDIENLNYKNNEDYKVKLNELENLAYKDLITVGKEKPLGYLPISTIEKYGKDTHYFKKYAKENNLGFKIVNDCNIWSGALYLYDKKYLKDTLSKYKHILKEASIPYTNIKFIDYISSTSIKYDMQPDAFIVIGLTFNDERFRKIKMK